jgi:hypothetical protein
MTHLEEEKIINDIKCFGKLYDRKSKDCKSCLVQHRCKIATKREEKRIKKEVANNQIKSNKKFSNVTGLNMLIERLTEVYGECIEKDTDKYILKSWGDKVVGIHKQWENVIIPTNEGFETIEEVNTEKTVNEIMETICAN